MYALKSYPRVIEPTTSVLELQLSAGTLSDMEANSAGTWRTLHRHVPPNDFECPQACIHLFGPDVSWERLPYLLGYDGAGVLRYMLQRTEDGKFDDMEFPEEGIGTPLLHPSVRYAFNSEAERDRFMGLVRGLELAGKVMLIHRPIKLDVAKV